MERLRNFVPLLAFAAAILMSVPCGAQPERRTPRVALVYTVTTPELKADVERAARETGCRIEVREVVIDGGFGMERGRFERLLAERIAAEASDADVVIFTQGSMAYVGGSVSRALGVPVLTNPVFSAHAVAEALAAKGLVGER